MFVTQSASPWIQRARSSPVLKCLQFGSLKDYLAWSKEAGSGWREGLVKTAKLDPFQNYIAGFHPHGILATGAFTNLCTEGTLLGFPRHPLTSDDDALVFLGPWLVSSDKESAAHILSRKGGGNLLSIVVGGVQESLNARPGTYKLVLRNRKGFIRLALTHGADLVPIFSFGENDICDQVENSPGSWLRWFHDRIQKSTRGSIPLFYGRGVFQYNFGLMPYRRPITTFSQQFVRRDSHPHFIDCKHRPTESKALPRDHPALGNKVKV
ncbi:hypothetical protein FD754_024849 [Muntiacus muntjak]|uniref:Acyltransferase n=1 Tax=Muntiacus muntjak TaxID=9888 RepID=A0A5N3UMV5_MUNMU|nr:hypothetical protein FD754_024849 [Muntiacus muntjak]